jgi:hypothetical protein
MFSTLSGTLISLRFLQKENASIPISLRLSGNFISFSPVQREKAPSSITVRLSGSPIDLRLSHPQKADLQIFVIPSGIVNFSKLLHPAKKLRGISYEFKARKEGVISISVSELHPEKTPTPTVHALNLTFLSSLQSLLCCVSCQDIKAGKIIRQFTNSIILG